jgi:indole-3-glycerol phosphate synthase
MSDLLADMAAGSRARAAHTRSRGLGAVVRAAARRTPRPLHPEPFSVIAEVKLRAPSAGALATPDDPVDFAVQQATAYADAGATAISVLTEPDRFGGHLAHLAAVAAAVDVPVMRKDFLVDPIQVWEAREAGASGVLLITRMLDDAALGAMLHAAAAAELFVLLEAFDEADLARSAALLSAPWGWRELPVWVGVNTRDLRTLEVRAERLAALAPALPSGFVAVAESGMASAADVRHAGELGYGAALVGTALMRADDPGALLAEMKASGAAGCS